MRTTVDLDENLIVRASARRLARMAERMQTSRRQLDRLLDSRVANVTLATMSKAARAIGRELYISLL
ncbi:MAG: hypothetical protein ACRER2_14145 [Methylococcales bacterium]